MELLTADSRISTDERVSSKPFVPPAGILGGSCFDLPPDSGLEHQDSVQVGALLRVFRAQLYFAFRESLSLPVESRSKTQADLVDMMGGSVESAKREFPYTDIEPLREGGFGKLYKARVRGTGEWVVLKIMKPRDQDDFERSKREMAVIAQFPQGEGLLKGFSLVGLSKHDIPGIPFSANKLVLEMEYIDGHDLEEIEADLSVFSHLISDYQEYLHRSQNDPEDVEGAFDVNEFKKSQFPRLYRTGGEGFLPLNELMLGQGSFESLPEDHVFSHEDMQIIIGHFLEQDEQLMISRLIAKAAWACEAVHKRGILHRDIKPSNIMLNPEGKVVLVDWGLSAAISGISQHTIDQLHSNSYQMHKSPFSSEASDAGEIVGTKDFMPPEYFDSEYAEENPIYTVASDIWAMGVTMSVMLTGAAGLPFRDDRTLDERGVSTREKALKYLRESLSTSPVLYEIVLTCLQMDPAKRFQSMRDLAMALDALPSVRLQDEFS